MQGPLVLQRRRAQHLLPLLVDTTSGDRLFIFHLFNCTFNNRADNSVCFTAPSMPTRFTVGFTKLPVAKTTRVQRDLPDARWPIMFVPLVLQHLLWQRLIIPLVLPHIRWQHPLFRCFFYSNFGGNKNLLFRWFRNNFDDNASFPVGFATHQMERPIMFTSKPIARRFAHTREFEERDRQQQINAHARFLTPSDRPTATPSSNYLINWINSFLR